MLQVSGALICGLVSVLVDDLLQCLDTSTCT